MFITYLKFFPLIPPYPIRGGGEEGVPPLWEGRDGGL